LPGPSRLVGAGLTPTRAHAKICRTLTQFNTAGHLPQGTVQDSATAIPDRCGVMFSHMHQGVSDVAPSGF